MNMLVSMEALNFDFKYDLHDFSTVVDSLIVVVLVVIQVVKHQFSKNPRLPLEQA